MANLEYYQQSLLNSKPLSRKDEAKYSALSKKGNLKARNRLVEANLRFVVAVALKYQGKGVPLEDLISAGNLGLIRASERFDESLGNKFISYAVYWIRQAILDTLSEDSNTIRVPANRNELRKKIWNFVGHSESKNGHSPSIDNIAKHLGVGKKLVTEILLFSQPIESLDSTSPDSTTPRIARLADENSPTPESAFFEYTRQTDIEFVLSSLEKREAEVIRHYFGIGTKTKTLQSIGKDFRLSKERIRQIRNDALRKLKTLPYATILRPHLQR